MAVLDRANNVIVLRIVYDGPAGAGKTTTVRCLAARLGRACTTPLEAGERTLFFDWVDYTGGLFEGYQLRCQIVSVPGQLMLADRREYLLGAADAVVYVSPVTEESVSRAMSALVVLGERLEEMHSGAVGVVLQANKRDEADALPAADIRRAMAAAGLRMALVEAIATDGSGVREGFVLAVRLALDRVREQIRTGTLREGGADIEDADMLLDRMRAELAVREPRDAANSAPTLKHATEARVEAAEAEDVSLAGAALRAIVEQQSVVLEPALAAGPTTTGMPEPPDLSVPSGMIWPPVEGRLCLADATSPPPKCIWAHGAWTASTERGWLFHSHGSAVFDDPEDGRGSLIRMARLHAAHVQVLSSPRCVVLARDGSGRYRLWQIVRERVSLRERLAASLDERDPNRIAQLFVDTAQRLLELDERVRRIAQSPVRVNFDTAGLFSGATQYVSTMPIHEAAGEPPRVSLEREFASILGDWAARRGELAAILRRSPAGNSPVESAVVRQLTKMLDG